MSNKCHINVKPEANDRMKPMQLNPQHTKRTTSSQTWLIIKIATYTGDKNNSLIMMKWSTVSKAHYIVFNEHMPDDATEGVAEHKQ